MFKYKIIRSDELYHYGRIGQKWGVLNGPPYPLDRQTVKEVYGNKKTGSEKKALNGKKRKVISGKELAKMVEDGGWKALNQFKDSKLLKASSEELLKGTNPHYHDAEVYKNNCVYAQVAYEFRKRGYDFQAVGRQSHKGISYISQYIAWDNGYQGFGPDTDNKAILKLYDKIIDKLKYVSYKENRLKYIALNEAADALIRGTHSKKDIYKQLSKHFESYGVGARGYIDGVWKNFECGHAFSWEVRKDGAYFLDGQSGKVLGKVSDGHYLEDMYLNDMYFCRLDDIKLKDFAPGILNSVIYEEKENKK